MDPNFTKYRISLDALDMNFLPITYSRNFNNLAPLWSYGLDRNEYFEFEIREKNDRNENLEAIETIKCHICNIEVPKVFINDHYKSKKHYINKRIADTALERIRKQLGDMKESDYFNNDNNVYFCPECVAVVQINNRKLHEKQQSHKYSVMFDKLLSDFHFIYANDDDQAINESDFSEVEQSDDFSKADELDLIADTNIVNNNTKIHHHDESDIESTLDTDESPKEIVKAHNNIKNDTINDFMKSNRFILIDTQDKITTDDTESSTSTKPNISEESNYHVDSSSSVNTESEAKYLSVIGEVINCKICYTRFDKNSLNSHINGTRHKMNKISDVHYMMKKSGDELYCIVCLKSLADTVESAKDHCSDTNHLSSYSKMIQENGIILKTNTLYCEICDKNIPKRNEFIHIFDRNHHKRKTQMIENFYCSVCEKYIPNMDVNVHDNSTEHKIKIKTKKEDFINGDDTTLIVAKEKIKETNILSNESPNEIKKAPHFCTICQVNVPNGANNIEIHYQGTRHKMKEKKRADEILQNKQKHTQSSSSLYKETSNISNVDKYTCEKISSETQTEAKSQFQQPKSQKPTTYQQATTMTQKHSTSTQQLTTTQKPSTSIQKPTSPIQQTKPAQSAVATQIVCELCNVKVPNNENNIREHENGRVHQDNYKNEEIVQKNNSYRCTICSLDIDNPLQHITESTHKDCKYVYNLLKKLLIDNTKQ